jgi:hypothetical protein
MFQFLFKSERNVFQLLHHFLNRIGTFQCVLVFFKSKWNVSMCSRNFQYRNGTFQCVTGILNIETERFNLFQIFFYRNKTLRSVIEVQNYQNLRVPPKKPKGKTILYSFVSRRTKRNFSLRFSNCSELFCLFHNL